MKIAVTAANGQLGRAIVKELIKEIGKENVIGIARTPEKAKDLGIEIRKGDYNSLDDFTVALEGVDKILLVSGMDTPENRIQQHRNIIAAAEKNKLNKIVYTSIMGKTTETAFGPVIKSNRQTEVDIENSKLEWAIGRNGLYIEPDLEYIDKYIKAGSIFNSAGDGKCAYTSRTELARAYVQILLNDDLKSEVYSLNGASITQRELTDCINEAYETDLSYKHLSVTEFLEFEKNALGEFLGTVVAGIYEGINIGNFDIESDFETVVGRSHKTVSEMIEEFKQNQ